MFNERKAKKQMNKYEGSTGAGAGYYRDQLDVLEQEPAEGVTFEKSMIFCMF